MAETQFQQTVDPDEPTVTVVGDRYVQMPEALLYDPNIDPLAKTVYGVLRRHGETPASCFPSHARIARFLGLSPRSVQRPILDLEASGWISRVNRPGTSSGYVVYADASSRAAAANEPRAVQRAPVALPRAGERGGCALENADHPALHSAPNESKKNESKRTNTPAALPLEVTDPFDAFWGEYPRRREKIKARKAWQAQVKRGAAPSDLTAAAANYARARRSTPPDKIKLPATFLGPDDVWRDWLDGGAALAEAEQAQWDASYGPEVVEY